MKGVKMQEVFEKNTESQDSQNLQDSIESMQDSVDSQDSVQDLESTDSTNPQDTLNSESSQDQKQIIKDLEEKYLRVYADFENTKKRLERDKNQALEYANERIIKDLLPVLDALESAKDAAKEHQAIFEGISHTKENLLKILVKYGVEEILTSGEFDPNLHECIMQVANPEVENGNIAQVLQKGYKYKERTLRPAMVAIAKND